ncbi:MAG: hypothetical protein ACJLS3_03305 [Erythrobacter sp.]
MKTERISITYRRMKIIARKTASGWEARAFDGKAPASEPHTGPSSDEVIVAVKAELDRAAMEERERRGDDGYPTADHVKKAFARLQPNDGQLAMLVAHLNATDHILTATQLAAAAGKDSFEYTNLQYGRLGRELAEEMEFTPAETSSATNQPIWTFTLATGTRDAAEAQPSDEYVEWRWKLRPEVVEALSRLGIR